MANQNSNMTTNNMSSNASDSTSIEGGEMKLNVVYAVFEILVAICAVVGNALVILVFHRERRLRRRTNYYIVSLAAADFLVGLLGIPFAILASVGLPRDLHACLFTVSLLVVLCTISIFCLVAVSIDRYWAILHPMGYSRNVRTKTAIGIIGVCWVAGSLFGFLPLLGWHADNAGIPVEKQMCLFTKVMDYNYLVFLYFATIIFPALLLAAFYAHIYQVVLKQIRQIVTMNPMPTGATSSRTVGGTGTMLRMLGAAQKREVKATQNLSIIVLFFIVCWFPLYTINCIQAFCPSCTVPNPLMYFCIILSHLNSAGNPLLYAYHLRDFRAALKTLLYGFFGKEETGTIDGQGIRPSMGSQNALHHHGINASSRNNSLQSMQNAGRLGLPNQQAYTDSPTLRHSGMLLPSTPVMTTNNSSMSSIVSGMSNIHQTAAAVPMGLDKVQQPDAPEARNKMWTLKEVPSISEDDPVPSTTINIPDDVEDYPQLRSRRGRQGSQVGSNGQVNSGYIDDTIIYGDEDDVFAATSVQNQSITYFLNELPFSHCSSGSMCDESPKSMSCSPNRVSSTEKRNKSLTNGNTASNDSDRLSITMSDHHLLVQAETNTNDDEHIELSPRSCKVTVISNGNGELKRADPNDDLKLPSPGGHRLSPLKVVSDFLLGNGNRNNRFKDPEGDPDSSSIPNEEASIAPDNAWHHNGSVLQLNESLEHS